MHQFYDYPSGSFSPDPISYFLFVTHPTPLLFLFDLVVCLPPLLICLNFYLDYEVDGIENGDVNGGSL